MPALDQLLHLDSSEYIAHLRTYNDTDLKANEIKKIRQGYTAYYAMCGSIGAAIVTHGLACAAAMLAGRKLYVAYKKLKLIQEELTRRNIALHETTWIDRWIPWLLRMSTMGLSFGFETELANLVLPAPKTLPTIGNASATPSLTNSCKSLPMHGNAISASLQGISTIGTAQHLKDQIHTMVEHVQFDAKDYESGALGESAALMQDVRDSTTAPQALVLPAGTDAKAFQQGANAAATGLTTGSVMLVSELADRISNACIDDTTEIKKVLRGRQKVEYFKVSSSCSRMSGGITVCNVCKELISRGTLKRKSRMQ